MTKWECPDCNNELIELRYEETKDNEYFSSSYFVTGDESETYWRIYAYWCENCEIMFKRCHKSWFEKYHSCKESVKTDD